MADFEATFRKLRSLAADIVLEGHGFAFDLEAKRHGKRLFVDPKGLIESAARAEADFRRLLAEQQAAREPERRHDGTAPGNRPAGDPGIEHAAAAST